MAAERTVSLRIFRYDPEIDGRSPKTPRYSTFNVPVEERMTLLEALRKIKDEQDGSLTFRSSCRSGICGSCGMRVNGFAKLACELQLSSAMERWGGELRIDPLGNFPILKDLVVDLEPFFEKIEKASPWMVPAEQPAARAIHPMLPEDNRDVGTFADCILCAVCYSECNSYEVDKGFIGPAATAKSARHLTDAREGMKRERGLSLLPEGLFWCTRCNFCTTECPKNVMPAEAFFVVKGAAEKGGAPPDGGARRSASVYRDIQHAGRVNEAMLPYRVWGLGAARLAPMGVKLLLRRKFPTPFPHRIEGRYQVQGIVRKAEELRQASESQKAEKRRNIFARSEAPGSDQAEEER